METESKQRYHRCDFWILIEEAEDVPGQWISHCLNLDIVSQGNSPEHAYHMIVEAIAITLTDDLTAGRNPFEHSSAPAEYWQRLKEMRDKGKAIPLKEAFAAQVKKIAFLMNFEILVEAPVPVVSPDIDDIPPAWMIEKIVSSPRHLQG
jgi:hypothetical protein